MLHCLSIASQGSMAGMPDRCTSPRLVVLICTDSCKPQERHLLLGMHSFHARPSTDCCAGQWLQLLSCLAAGLQARTVTQIVTLFTEQVLRLSESQQANQLHAIR